MKSRRNRSKIATRGQALVEFALILPLLVILLVAVFDVGRFIFAYNAVTNAAREGARLAIVNQDPTLVTQRALDQASVAEVAAPNVSIIYYQPQPNTVDVTQNARCGNNGVPANGKPVLAGCVAVLSFQTTMRPITPIIGRIL